MSSTLTVRPHSNQPKSRPLKVLLLENIHPLAHEMFNREGCQVESLKSALTPAELGDKLRDVDVLGIRSKTQVTAEALSKANNLLTLGCFCIGTNQVDLTTANSMGVPVFNAPFSNTRSVAEMVIAEIIMLARQLGTRNNEMHRGSWQKVSANCFEVRGKTLGIVGYGHIGTQVSTLAEALGMRVVFYDIISKLSLGNAKPHSSLVDLLRDSDFVTLHVPATPQTSNMISAAELEVMKKGSYLINASRGTVVDVRALADSLKAGHLAGAALDVFPEEPEGNTEKFESLFKGLSNVILTPHIGGATEEAQANIGREVASNLLRFMMGGSTTGAVNFPVVDIPSVSNAHRILNVHRNVPGVLKEINRIVSEVGANIQAQALATDPDIGYLVMDLDKQVALEVKIAIESLKTSIRTRILY